MFLHRAVLLGALFSAACTASDLPDSGPNDSGQPDTGQPDTGLTDSGPEDSGVVPPVEIDCPGCTVFRGGKVFDGTAFLSATVVVSGEKITRVVTGPVEITAGELVDLSGKTLVPGLFDLHVHMGPSAAGGAVFLEDPMTPHLKAMLRRGVTSFLDLGTGDAIFEARSRVRDGRWLGPNMYVAGPLITPPGGHPCYEGQPALGCVLLSDPAQISRLDPVFARAPDVLKVVIESGSATRPLPQLAAGVIGAVREAADRQGIKVIAHVSEASDIELALAHGITRFAHVPLRDDISPELASRLAQLGAVFVPTLAVVDAPVRLFEDHFDELDDPAITDDVPAEVIAAIRSPAFQTAVRSKSYGEFWLSAQEHVNTNVQTLKNAGVKILAGTDAGNDGTFHGRAVLRELELYVELGFTTAETLTAATRDAADFLGSSERGRIAEGAFADLLIVEGDAEADITALRATDSVYLKGALLDRTRLIVSSTTTLELQPIREQAIGAACFNEDECAAGGYCGYQGVCAAECSVQNGGCDTGSACFQISFASDVGFCYRGDGCDVVEQNCENHEACIWLGNAASLCWFAGTSTAGQSCDANGYCAAGAQCDFASNSCLALCDPASPDMPACPEMTSCMDISAVSGLPIGECR